MDTIKLIEDTITEITERIVIDYANLSVRESENRAGFREKTRIYIHTTLLKIAEAEVERLEKLGLGEETKKWVEELRDEVKKFCLYCGVKPEKLNKALQDQITHWQEIIDYLKSNLKGL